MIQKNSDAGAVNYFYSSNLHLIFIKEIRTDSVQAEFDIGIHVTHNLN